MKFLADEGFPHKAAEMLKKLGWDVREIVIDVPQLRGTDDIKDVLVYAKRTGRVLISADMFKDRPTRMALWRNIRNSKRGKVISVAGAAENIPTQIVGKLLFHQDRWEVFFEQGQGIAQIGDLKADMLRMWRPEQLNVMTHLQVRQGAAYINRPRQLPFPKAPKPVQPGASARLVEVP